MSYLLVKHPNVSFVIGSSTNNTNGLKGHCCKKSAPTALWFNDNVVEQQIKPIKRINATRQWTQAFYECNKSIDINMLCLLAKFALFGERLRSLIPTVGFVSFVRFVVETKKHACFWQKTTIINKRGFVLTLQRKSFSFYFYLFWKRAFVIFVLSFYQKTAI